MTSSGSGLRSNCSRAKSWRCYGGRLTISRNEARHCRTTCATPSPPPLQVQRCKMVYSWDDKEGECYRLYVEEKRSLDEVISYWEVRGFTPRYVAARLHVRFAVFYCTSRAFNTSFADSTTTRVTMLTSTCQQTSVSDAVQGTLPSLHSPSHCAQILTTLSDGTSQANRTPHTRTPPSSPAYTSYGNRITRRRTWSIPYRLKAFLSTTAS
jgi:hypothetical protein